MNDDSINNFISPTGERIDADDLARIKAAIEQLDRENDEPDEGADNKTVGALLGGLRFRPAMATCDALERVHVVREAHKL